MPLGFAEASDLVTKAVSEGVKSA